MSRHVRRRAGSLDGVTVPSPTGRARRWRSEICGLAGTSCSHRNQFAEPVKAGDPAVMTRGTVKFFKPDKGCGAIASADFPDGCDAWVYFSAIGMDGSVPGGRRPVQFHLASVRRQIELRQAPKMGREVVC